MKFLRDKRSGAGYAGSEGPGDAESLEGIGEESDDLDDIAELDDDSGDVDIDDFDGADADDADAQDEARRGPGGKTTAKKGRPTPKRSEAQGRRGPVGPAPMTGKEARARKRLNRDGTKKTRGQRKAESAERRATMADRRERMMAGEEKFLPQRDRGPARRMTRDMVDSRRHLVGLFMPLAIIMILSMFVQNGLLQMAVSLVLVVMIVAFFIEGILLGHQVNKQVRERHPDTAVGRFSLGWYAFVRASQLRRMRTPRPAVAIGDDV